MRANAFTARQRINNVCKSLRHTGAKIGVAVAGMTAAPFAFASSDPGAAILSEITGAKGTVGGILVALAAVLGLFLLWSMIKRAK